MRHSLITQGYGVRLRPVRLDDAPFIVWLRNLDYAIGRVGDSATDVGGQERWLNSYFEREGDYYFIVETLHEVPLGTHSIYNLKDSRGEIGRLVIRPGVPSGLLASFLILDLSRSELGVTQVLSRCVATNGRAQSHLHNLGFSQVKVEHEGRIIGGQAVDILHYAQSAGGWLRVRAEVVRAVQRAEPGIREWEQDYRKRSDPHGLLTEP